jgi:hypothetical protein
VVLRLTTVSTVTVTTAHQCGWMPCAAPRMFQVKQSDLAPDCIQLVEPFSNTRLCVHVCADVPIADCTLSQSSNVISAQNTRENSVWLATSMTFVADVVRACIQAIYQRLSAASNSHCVCVVKETHIMVLQGLSSLAAIVLVTRTLEHIPVLEKATRGL